MTSTWRIVLDCGHWHDQTVMGGEAPQVVGAVVLCLASVHDDTTDPDRVQSIHVGMDTLAKVVDVHRVTGSFH